MDVVFDTGSADMWSSAQYPAFAEISAHGLQEAHPASFLCLFLCRVFSSQTEPKLPYLHYFHGEASSTYQPSSTPWQIRYGKGSVSGLLCADVVTVANLTARLHRFAEATSFSSDLVNRELPLDGIVGMAFSDISRAKVTTQPSSLAHTTPMPQFLL